MDCSNELVIAFKITNEENIHKMEFSFCEFRRVFKTLGLTKFLQKNMSRIFGFRNNIDSFHKKES